MGKDFNCKREKMKLTAFFVLMVIFAVATLAGGILVIRFHFNAVYSLLPALLAFVFLQLCKRSRRRIQNHGGETTE